MVNSKLKTGDVVLLADSSKVGVDIFNFDHLVLLDAKTQFEDLVSLSAKM